MTALLWTLLILGLIEVGTAMAFLATGNWPQRTRASIVGNLITWAALAAWIVVLIAGGAA